MLEQISDLVRQYGQQTIVDNPDIPNGENNAVLAEATNTITSGMQNMLAGGGLQDIISMFTGGGNNNTNTISQGNGGIQGLLKNPMVTMMIGHLISKLTSKYNMSASQASNVSNSLIPNVIGDLVKRTTNNDPSNDAFDLNDLIGSLTGGKVATSESSAGGFNFQDLLGQLTSGNGNSGGINLQDIINQVTNGAQQNKEKEATQGGGIADMIKGLFS